MNKLVTALGVVSWLCCVLLLAAGSVREMCLVCGLKLLKKETFLVISWHYMQTNCILLVIFMRHSCHMTVYSWAWQYTYKWCGNLVYVRTRRTGSKEYLQDGGFQLLSGEYQMTFLHDFWRRL